MAITWSGTQVKVIAIDYGTGYDPNCRTLANVSGVCAYNPGSAYSPYEVAVLLELVTCTDLGGCDTIATIPEGDLSTAKKTVEFVVAVKNGVIYFIRPVYDTGAAAFLLLAPTGAEKVDILGYHYAEGKMVPVVMDSELNVVQRISTIEIGLKDVDDNLRVLELPATVGVLTAIIILAALGATGVGLWKGFEYLKAKEQAEAARYMASAAQANANVTRYMADKCAELVASGNPVKLEDYIKCLQGTSTVAATAGALTKVAPTESPPDNVQDWVGKIFGFVKDIVPFIIGALGLIVVLFKFNVLSMVMDAVRDILRGFRRRR